jgi:hypothetical protein
MVSSIVAAAICISLLEIPSLWRKRLWKELWIFFALLSLGTALSIARALQATIWNPTDWIMHAFQPMSKYLIGMFK